MFKEKIFAIILTYLTIFLVQDHYYCQSSDISKDANTSQSNNDSSEMEILDALFMESNFEELTKVLIERSKQGDTNVINYLIYLDYISDTIIELTKVEIQSKSYVTSIENIKLLDDLDYYMTRSDLGWKSFSEEIFN